MNDLIQKIATLLFTRFGKDRKFQISWQRYTANDSNKSIVSKCNAILIFNYCPTFDPVTATGGVTIFVNGFPIFPNSYWSPPANFGEVDWSDYPLSFNGGPTAAAADQVVVVGRKNYMDKTDF